MNSKKDADRGLRLRDERKRLGFIQKGIAAEVGLGEVAWVNYEKGDRAPDQRTLEALHEKGFDVLYLVTGVRSQLHQLPEAEQELLTLYRTTALNQRDGLLMLARTYATAHSGASGHDE